ncbi:MAG: hypothetical protein M0R66_02975 [Candidatus Omnitrophica bacterium]|nr:hypothetical protein [Candidatus Omnitrophota bacterium]
MTEIDPNLWASLARQYTGGINAPSPGQEGFVAVANSAGTNLDYVARGGILGDCSVRSVGAVVVDLENEVYATIGSGTFVAGVEDTAVLSASTTAAAVTCGAGGRLLINASFGLTVTSGTVTAVAKVYVDGVDSGAAYSVVSVTTTSSRVSLSTIVAVDAGSVVDIRIANYTDSKDITAVDYHARYELRTAP